MWRSRKCNFGILVFCVSALLADSRHAMLRRFELTAGRLPKFDHHTSLEVRVLEEVKLDHYVRRKILFRSPDGDFIPAYLLLPDGPGKHAAMLCLHQTTPIGKDEPAGLGGKPNLRYAAELAERGYVALAPDYPSFGDYTYAFDQPNYVSGTMKGIANHMRAVDLLVSLANVETKGIGVIGHSLGGHNALFLTAFDQRVRAVVTSCGFTSLAKYMHGNLKGWDQKRYMPLIGERYHNSPVEVPWDFPDILGAIAPRAIFINAPLHDDNFEVSGVDDSLRPVKKRFRPTHLIVAHPDCAHDFPPEVREQAYRFLDGHLRPASQH
jgi:dienelactone hydrolase